MTREVEQKERRISNWKLALGAASLFFFVVGVKRSFRTDDGREILKSDADRMEEDNALAPSSPIRPHMARRRRHAGQE